MHAGGPSAVGEGSTYRSGVGSTQRFGCGAGDAYKLLSRSRSGASPTADPGLGRKKHSKNTPKPLRGYSDATFKYSKDTWLPTLRPYTAPTHADTPTPENTPKTLTCDGATSAVARVAAQCASAATPLRHHPISCCRPCRLRMVGSIYTPGC